MALHSHGRPVTDGISNGNSRRIHGEIQMNPNKVLSRGLILAHIRVHFNDELSIFFELITE